MNTHHTSQSKKRKRSEDAVDFETLAETYSDFRREWQAVQAQQQQVAGSFSSVVTPEFNIALTRALIHSKFGVSLPSLPLNRLCPPVPNRFAYVKWLQDDLMPLLCAPNDYFSATKPLQYRGLDIGTGASCIFPILFTCNNVEWKMDATEIDAESIQSARTNVEANQLTSRISIHLVKPTRVQQQSNSSDDAGGGPIARAFECIQNDASFDFVMTNPPFFDSTSDIQPRADNRDRTPMTEYEGSYPGGEVGFVCDMIRDSLVFRDRVGWYSSMCGKKASFLRLKHFLVHLLGPGHVQFKEVASGYMTRWFLAWTFRRPKITSPATKVGKTLCFDINIDDTPDAENPLDEVVSRVNTYCETLPGWSLSTSVTPKENGQLIRIVEEPTALASKDCDATMTIPERLFDVVEQEWDITTFLPDEGHFLVEVFVTRTQPQVGAENTITVSVSAESHQHSNRGAKALEKIRGQLQGEICRTNRRWRRLLKRQAAAKNESVDAVAS